MSKYWLCFAHWLRFCFVDRFRLDFSILLNLLMLNFYFVVRLWFINNFISWLWFMNDLIHRFRIHNWLNNRIRLDLFLNWFRVFLFGCSFLLSRSLFSGTSLKWLSNNRCFHNFFLNWFLFHLLLFFLMMINIIFLLNLIFNLLRFLLLDLFNFWVVFNLMFLHRLRLRLRIFYWLLFDIISNLDFSISLASSLRHCLRR